MPVRSEESAGIPQITTSGWTLPSHVVRRKRFGCGIGWRRGLIPIERGDSVPGPEPVLIFQAACLPAGQTGLD